MFSGDKAFMPKGIIADEQYDVVAVKHTEVKEIVVENKKKREYTSHMFTYFVINDNFRMVSIPDYNAKVFLEGSNAAPKKKD